MIKQASITVGRGVLDFLGTQRSAIAGDIGDDYGLTQHILQICAGIKVSVAPGAHGNDHVDGFGGPVSAAILRRGVIGRGIRAVAAASQQAAHHYGCTKQREQFLPGFHVESSFLVMFNSVCCGARLDSSGSCLFTVI